MEPVNLLVDDRLIDDDGALLTELLIGDIYKYIYQISNN